MNVGCVTKPRADGVSSLRDPVHALGYLRPARALRSFYAELFDWEIDADNRSARIGRPK
jgi:hypothetical protein